MFFNRHIKQGKEIGELINGNIQSCLVGIKTGYDENGRYIIPDDFFTDSYICGFIHVYVGLIIDFGLGGSNWSKTKKGECVISALDFIDTNGTLRRKLIDDIGRDQYLYQNGTNDAVTVAGLMFGKLKPDDPDAKVIAANSMARELMKTEPTMSDNEALVAAAVLVTLREYIHQNWS